MNYLKTLIILFIWGNIYSCNNSKKANIPLPYKNDKDILEIKADSLYKIDQYPIALIVYKCLINLDSSNGSYYFKSGYCEAQMLFFSNSIIDFKKAALLNYRKASCYRNLSSDYNAIDSESLVKYYAQKCVEVDSTKKKDIQEMLSKFDKFRIKKSESKVKKNQNAI